CSGLRMLMIFVALATAVAMIGERRFWQRILLVLSAVPIALIANVTRITATGSLHAMGYDEFADLVFHDLAGWLMMPLALGLLGLEVAFLDRLLIVESDEPVRLAAGESTTDRRQAGTATASRPITNAFATAGARQDQKLAGITPAR